MTVLKMFKPACLQRNIETIALTKKASVMLEKIGLQNREYTYPAS